MCKCVFIYNMIDINNINFFIIILFYDVISYVVYLIINVFNNRSLYIWLEGNF